MTGTRNRGDWPTSSTSWQAALLLAAGLFGAALTGCRGPAIADPADTSLDGSPAPDATTPTPDTTIPDAAFDAAPPPLEPLTFAAPGSLSAPAGLGTFRFGAATAAAQIEDGLTNNDWYWWTLPVEAGGKGKGAAPVGDAVRGFTRALDDIALIDELGLDAYRFSIDWSRIEPTRDAVDEPALDHYDAVIDGLVGADVRPMITVHHFSSPIWVDDFRTPCATNALPGDANLCGWGHAEGAEAIIAELAEHAALLAQRYGDRVDEWCTLNEPVNYLFAAYGVGMFPPGEDWLITDFERFTDVFRNYLRAHVAVYDAIKANDLVDADGDGIAAAVGLSLSVVDWQPARANLPSDHPDDVAASERVAYVYHHLYPDALVHGGFDADLDGSREEPHPDWAGKLDWLGAQYYFRAGVTAEPSFLPGVEATICFSPLDFGSCLPVEDATKWVPTMHYEYYEPGIRTILGDLSERYPGLPLVVTEAGIATQVGARRAENVVRTLEQIHLAIEDGADVRGYYHWSLMDNFEWAEGYEPKFGLYSVELESYERAPTAGATVLQALIDTRTLSVQSRETYGGVGPMTPEEGAP